MQQPQIWQCTNLNLILDSPWSCFWIWESCVDKLLSRNFGHLLIYFTIIKPLKCPASACVWVSECECHICEHVSVHVCACEWAEWLKGHKKLKYHIIISRIGVGCKKFHTQREPILGPQSHIYHREWEWDYEFLRIKLYCFFCCCCCCFTPLIYTTHSNASFPLPLLTNVGSYYCTLPANYRNESVN